MGKENDPIGIFDSGIGGLTVAHAIKKLLPNESLIYFGDTAHLPYGDKSEAAIQAYSVKIANLLLEKGCKVIVIACNSASSAASDLLREYVNNEARIINVIDPMIDLITSRYSNAKIGLIGTRRTVQSDVYSKKLAERGFTSPISALATPLLAPMIEDGFFNSQISREIINEYLSNSRLSDIDVLILACTHYPLIKKEISEFYNNRIPVLDSAEVVAHSLNAYLTENNLRSTSADSWEKFYVSDFTDSFEASTRIFFRQAVHLEKLPLWR